MSLRTLYMRTNPKKRARKKTKKKKPKAKKTGRWIIEAFYEYNGREEYHFWTGRLWSRARSRARRYSLRRAQEELLTLKNSMPYRYRHARITRA